MQSQTLDSIFSAKVSPQPTAATTSNAPSQSLQDIFGTKNTANRPSLGSIFSAAPTPSKTDTFLGGNLTPLGEGVKNFAVDTYNNVKSSLDERNKSAIETNKNYAEGKIGLAQATLNNIGQFVGGAFDITTSPLKTAGITLPAPTKGSVVDMATKKLSEAAQKPVGDITNSAQSLADMVFKTRQAAKLETDPVKQQRLNEVADHQDKVSQALFGEAYTTAAKLVEGGKSAEAVSNIGTAILGGGSAKEVGGDLGTIAKTTTGAVKNAAEDVSNIAGGLKEKVMPTPSVDELTGKVLQGKTGDITSGKAGLSTLDTSGVKTYADLNKVSKNAISSEAKAQDAALAQDATPRKIQQLAVKVGDQAGAHNYVIDALGQLKDYFTKTNDIANLGKVNTYLGKIDPVKGEGLTVTDVNNIARMHGTNLNGYNANGELASGLTKQAAENTRQGLKQTVIQSIQDPALRKVFQASDAKMSNLYTVKELSSNMAEKVNTLTQRLQKPNILQKIGGLIGKATRITGVGDFASKLLGIDKVPGAATLNAVELEAKLSSNLEKINAALQKDDAGFIQDINNMSKELNVKEEAPKPQASIEKPWYKNTQSGGITLENPFAKDISVKGLSDSMINKIPKAIRQEALDAYTNLSSLDSKGNMMIENAINDFKKSVQNGSVTKESIRDANEIHFMVKGNKEI